MSLGRIGIIVFVSLAAYIIYYTLRDILFSKININKWIVFTGALLVLYTSRFIVTGSSRIYSYILSGLFVVLLLWFYDIFNAESKKVTESKIIDKARNKSKKITNGKKKK